MSDTQDAEPIEQIAPDNFLDTWGASSYSEALDKAERAKTTTDESDLPRCPACGSRRVKSKTPKYTGNHTKDGDYVCITCSPRHHFDEPVYGEFESFEWVTTDDLEKAPVDRRLYRLDETTLTALTIFLYRPWNHTESDPSYRDLGKVLPYSRTWAGDRIREWKDGDHRHLVADPRPRVSFAAQPNQPDADSQNQ